MIYLMISLAGFCMLSIGFKLVSIYQADMKRVIFINYVTATVLTMAVTVLSLKDKYSFERFGNNDFWKMMCLAIALGFSMIQNLWCTEVSTDKNGLGSTTFFSRAGFLICIVLSAVLWKDFPGMLQAAGILVLLISMAEMMRGTQDGSVAGDRKLFPVLFIGSGLVFFFNAVYGKYFPAEHKPLFLSIVFMMTLISSVVLLFRGEREQSSSLTTDILLGGMIGISNAVGTFFQLKSLDFLSVAVVMPVSAAGNLLIVALAGRFCFKEKGNRHTAAAIVLAVISLILINL